MDTIFKLKNFLFSFFHIIDKSFQEELNIALPQFMVLLAISHNPMGTQAMLSEFRKITPAGISKQITILLKKKLIMRKNSKSDKREHSIILTQGGKKMFDFNIIVVSAIGVGSLAFSFLEYVLTRKKKQQKEP